VKVVLSVLGSILTTSIKLGKHALLNRGNQIGHDCTIGDYFSMMPGAIVGGNVSIGKKVYMGSCSNIREKTRVVSNVTIGMNAAIVKPIDNSGIYVGVPAKRIK
jgi:UDP-3-O-[3-hydroxymyristoyl] glucosamine N-acyltransferase